MLSKMENMSKMAKLTMMKPLSLCLYPKMIAMVTSSADSLPDVRVMVMEMPVRSASCLSLHHCS